MSNRARRGLAALFAPLLLVTMVVTAERASAAGPTEIALSGHGNGHGRGMGQFGAKGYADGGMSAGDILAHYYGGTTAGTHANNQIKVLLCDLEGVSVCTTGPGVNQIVVTSTAAFTFEQIHDAFPANTALRITRDNANNRWLVDQAPGGCSATTYAPVGAGFTGDPVIDLDPDAAMLQVCAPKARTYRGSLKFVVTGSANTPRLIDYVLVEDYLKGVVPSEMPSSWHPEALKVQAVAARSYALSGDNRFPNLADTCDTTQCQVYRGFSGEAASTNTAVDQTAGQVRILTSNGSVARTEFSSSTGGYTAGGTFPPVPDDGDATPSNPYHNWSTTVPVSQIEQAYPAIGAVQGVTVLTRNGLGADGGRVTKVRIVGASSSVDLSGTAFQSAFGLRSDWFSVGVSFARLAAADRYATAATIAQSTFQTADTALIARGDGPDAFADGLAANYLGGVDNAPTLLATSTSVPASTFAALTALGVKTIHLLGGTSSLSADVLSSLQAKGYTVDRIAGTDRYGTAAAIAHAAPAGSIGTVESQPTAVLSSGASFPDSIAAGGIVYGRHFPQLLSGTTTLPAATVSTLQDLGIKHVIITGGTSTISTDVENAVKSLGITTERAAGPTRYDTAAALASIAVNRLGFSAVHMDVATGESFPDALTGGSHAGRNQSPILLTAGASVPTPTCGFLKAESTTTTSGHLFGGTASISNSTKAALETCLKG